MGVGGFWGVQGFTSLGLQGFRGFLGFGVLGFGVYCLALWGRRVLGLGLQELSRLEGLVGSRASGL